jgi:putative permease
MNVISDWFRRRLSDPQIVILAALLITGVIVVVFLGKILAPVLASLVIAYLLEGLVGKLERRRVPRLIAVLVVILIFMIFVLFVFLMLLPLLWQQLKQLFQQLPVMITWAQNQLLYLPEKYPDYISNQQIMDLITVLSSEIRGLGQRVLTLSVASVKALIWIMVYIVLTPIMVFLFLKDKNRLLNWATGFLPKNRRLATEVWHEVDQQIGNYVRGKFWEILIVWTASALTFTVLGLEFASLVSLFVGLSVLVPYVGAFSMAFPVALLAFFQWGFGPDFAYVGVAYLLLQILDGNLLAPLLLSEVVNLHAVAIIVAVLVFGGIWGFWGVFFAIPLATLVQATIKAFARHRMRETIEVVEQEPKEVESAE